MQRSPIPTQGGRGGTGMETHCNRRPLPRSALVKVRPMEAPTEPVGSPGIIIIRRSLREHKIPPVFGRQCAKGLAAPRERVNGSAIDCDDGLGPLESARAALQRDDTPSYLERSRAVGTCGSSGHSGYG